MNTTVIILKKLWNFVDSLNNQTKTLLIILLCTLFIVFYTKSSNKIILSDYIDKMEQIEHNADKYTIKIAPKINECITTIQRDDKDCYNVLLLNYHNSKKSIQGIRYLYLNCIAESPKGIEDDQIKQFWTELEYMYYQDELSKIHNQGYLRVEHIDSIKSNFPKLYKKLLISEAQSAAFYPIEGVDSSIGMIVVLYRKPKVYSLGFYNRYISPQIQRLSTLLDYPNLKFND